MKKPLPSGEKGSGSLKKKKKSLLKNARKRYMCFLYGFSWENLGVRVVVRSKSIVKLGEGPDSVGTESSEK